MSTQTIIRTPADLRAAADALDASAHQSDNIMAVRHRSDDMRRKARAMEQAAEPSIEELDRLLTERRERQAAKAAADARRRADLDRIAALGRQIVSRRA